VSKPTSIAVLAGVCVALAFGGLYASNMGFELNRLLEQQTSGVSLTGQSQVGLPYFPEVHITNVSDLRDDINASAGVPGCVGTACAVVSISRFVRSSDSLQTYTGAAADLPNVYPIDGVEGQRIQVRQRVNYVILGSHDPGRVVNLDSQGTGGSRTGQTELSFPYHGTAGNAGHLYDEINASSPSGNGVVSISRFVESADALVTYSHGVVDHLNNFGLKPGESYRIQVREDIAYVPSHY